jgi:hypothetical protein
MKTLVYGLAKSGTTVLHRCILDAMRTRFGADVLSVFEPKARRFNEGDGWVYECKGLPPQRERPHTLVKALLAPEHGIPMPQVIETFDDFDFKIFINRDPRDRWISVIFYRWFHGNNPDAAAFKRALELVRFKESHPALLPFYSIFSTHPVKNVRWQRRQKIKLAKLSQFIAAAPGKGWFVINYEDLVDGRTEALSHYLGLELNNRPEADKVLKRLSRSSGYGSWRRWFTADDVAFYRPVFNDFLDRHGYGSSDWTLEPVEHLPSAEGSEYMQNLYYPARSRAAFG